MRTIPRPLLIWFARRVRFRIPQTAGSIARIRDLLRGAPPVYVLAGSTALDHLLMNALALQQDLPPGRVVSLSDRKNPCWKEPLRFVPVFFGWGRTPPRIPPTCLDRFLGPIETPGRLRRLFLLFGFRASVVAQFGEPIFSEAAGEDLRPALRSAFRKERKVFAGPPIRSRKRVIRALLRSRDVRQAVEAASHREKKNVETVRRRAERILKETVADFNPRTLAFSRVLVRWLWDRMFDRLYVDREGIDRLRPALRNHPVVLTPCHKSHMDYLLLSLVFYESDIAPPHIAAGINLSFFPFGWIFRTAGAFFMRRSVLGEALYAPLLASYVRFLISKGFTQEFFIEGGRTRTGKLVVPKRGLLTLEIDAFLEGASRDLFLVPIAITYERVPEDESYEAELSGKPKAKENFWTVWKSRRRVRRSHGAAYLRFSEPISLGAYVAAAGAREPLKLRKELTAALAREIVRKIARETTVTTTSLLSTALLSRDGGDVAQSDLTRHLLLLLDLFREAGAPLAPEAVSLETELPRTLDFFENNGWIVRTKSGVAVPEEKRLLLDFYKNTTLHFLLPVAVAAFEGDRRSIAEIALHEFTPEENETAETILAQGEERLARRSAAERSLLSGLLANYADSYELAGRAASEGIGNFPPSGDAIRRIRSLGESLPRKEALSEANLKSAFGHLHAKKVLSDPVALRDWLGRFRGQARNSTPSPT